MDPVSSRQDFWPPEDAFVPLTGASQFTDQSARCTKLAICNDAGDFTYRFHQGQRAHFFFEFEILVDIRVPSGGVEFANEAGIVVHGKNTFQHHIDPPAEVHRGARLRYHYWFDLQMAPDRYTVHLGLAGTDPASYEEYVHGDLDFREFNGRTREHCRVMRAAVLLLDMAEGGKLLHHGVANLPCSASLQVVAGAEALPRTQALASAADAPTLFHITHWKAGSQWIYRILRCCVPDRIVEPEIQEAQVRYYAIQRGRVYPTVYLSKAEFDRVNLPENSKVFVVIRDLRDTLVSAYFSFKTSHPVLELAHLTLRATLESLDKESGLLYLLENWMPACAQIQLSWLESDAIVLKYEDLLERDAALLREVLLDRLAMPIDPRKLEAAIVESRFETLTGGRPRGTEDASAHARKGTAGDWREHFSERVKKAFKARHGGLLAAAGYEKDLSW